MRDYIIQKVLKKWRQEIEEKIYQKTSYIPWTCAGGRVHKPFKQSGQGTWASGWVRNLYDGTVECEIQGTPGMVDDFISMLQNGRYIEIDFIEQKETALKEETCFRIRY